MKNLAGSLRDTSGAFILLSQVPGPTPPTPPVTDDYLFEDGTQYLFEDGSYYEFDD